MTTAGRSGGHARRRAAPTRALLTGVAAARVLATGGDGVAVAWFPKATYVRMPGGLMALTAPTALPGPLHVVLDTPLAARPGAGVVRSGTGLLVGDALVALHGARPWVGLLPGPVEMRRSAALVVEAASWAAAHSALLAHPYREPARRALELLRAGDVVGTVGLLCGLGPGLTPAGDDAVAGMLLAMRALGGAGSQAQLQSALRAARTTALSLAVLECAAAGQSIAPVHQLLEAAARQDRVAAVAAAGALAEVGASSGADLCFGLLAALSAATDPQTVQVLSWNAPARQAASAESRTSSGLKAFTPSIRSSSRNPYSAPMAKRQA
jgi:Protein of unknown function (DUF2877)